MAMGQLWTESLITGNVSFHTMTSDTRPAWVNKVFTVPIYKALVCTICKQSMYIIPNHFHSTTVIWYNCFLLLNLLIIKQKKAHQERDITI